MTWLVNALPLIGTALTLAAFVVALALLAYRARLKQRASIIAATPQRDRLAAIEATAEYLRVDVSGLSPKVKHDIVVRQLKIRERRGLLLAVVAMVITAVLGVLVLVEIRNASPNATPAPQDIAQNCYRFDAQTDRQLSSLGLRPCYPGKIVYFKYWDPSKYPNSTWPTDRPNRVIQVTGIANDGRMRWTEQNLTNVINDMEIWSHASHFWVSVIDDIGIGGGIIGFVLRRIDVQPIPVADGGTQCDSDDKMRNVLEFAIPANAISSLSTGKNPTLRMRWVAVSCFQEVGFNPLVGPGYRETSAPIIAAVSD